MTNLPSTLVRLTAAGDSALVAEFPQRIDPEVNQRAASLASRLRQEWGAILRDVVIGYCTVTIYFDPLRVDARWLEAEVRAIAQDSEGAPGAEPRVIEVPVCYDPEFAPDLADVAAFGGCSTEEVVELHASGVYRVYMVGFVPGFAYLAQVDDRIAMPRRTVPRTAVPAGSVAIAGGQTGVYPRITPGGWNIIGRTPLKPYDPERPDPFLFRVGDDVRFIPMTREAFERSES